MLKQLGFTSYFAAARKGNQETLIHLLYQFKLSLNNALSAEIVSKGTASVLLNQVA